MVTATAVGLSTKRRILRNITVGRVTRVRVPIGRKILEANHIKTIIMIDLVIIIWGATKIYTWEFCFEHDNLSKAYTAGWLTW